MILKKQMKSRFNNYLGISSLGIKTITIILIFVFVIQTKHFAQAFYCTEIKLPSEIPAINDLYVNKGILYIATSQGLYTYNDKGFTRFFDPENTDAYRINTICPDKAGNLWFGTYIGLLVKFSANKVLFVQDIKPKCKTDNYLITSISIDTVFKNQNSEVLLSTSGGELFGYNTISNSVKKYENPGPGTVFSIIYGYWPLKCVYTADGFFSMNKNMKWKKKKHNFPSPSPT